MKRNDEEALLRRIYEIYSDFALKNPFYSIDMPIRCPSSSNPIQFKLINFHLTFSYLIRTNSFLFNVIKANLVLFNVIKANLVLFNVIKANSVLFVPLATTDVTCLTSTYNKHWKPSKNIHRTSDLAT